jgi:dihydrofolate reductase
VELVVAMSRDGLIGRAGTLLWHLPRDLRHFRRLTWGKPIIMGRKTHQSMGRPLPGRTNIVLTHQEPFHAEGCLVAHSRDQALQLAAATGASEAMIIGGRAVYQAFLPLCRTIHLTLVEGTFEGDTFFPANVLESPDWQAVEQERWPADEQNPFNAAYLLLTRRDPSRGEPQASIEASPHD